MKYDIKLFDIVKVIHIDKNGDLRDVVRTGAYGDREFQVIEIYHDERWGWKYVIMEGKFPYPEYHVGEDDIYEINHPPEVFYEQRDPYGEES